MRHWLKKDCNISIRRWQIGPTTTKAMSYMNLVYRRKADVDYGDTDAVKADVAAAKDWASKAMGTP